MPQSRVLRARGLYTFYNRLSELPEGALVQADNVIVDRNSVIEPRRGIAKFGTDMPDPDDRTKQLLVYKDRILRHFNNTIEFDSDGAGTFSAFAGSYLEPETGIRIKYIEANSNLYFTTDSGVQKISAVTAADFTTATDFIRPAGGPRALDVTGEISYNNPGFFSTLSKVAYRVVWGQRDANNNLILGSPSSRLVVTNFSDTSTGTVDLQFAIPEEISNTDTSFFYQVYRTGVFQQGTLPTLDDVEPGDEMNLVIEDFPTSTELTNRLVEVSDITPEDFRVGGTLLYTNPVSGEGILQANEPPPVAKDIALFKNTVFYANTQSLHQVDISFLSVSQLVSGTSEFTITDGTTTNTYTFVGTPEITDFTFDTFANTTDGGYFLINSASNSRNYFVYMDKTGSTAIPNGVDTTGRLSIQADISGATTANDVATIVATALNNNSDFSVPAPVGDTITVTTLNNGNTDDAVDGLTGVGGAFAVNITQQGDGENAGALEVLLSGAVSPSQQIDETARSLVNIINRNSNDIVSAFYLSGENDVPGQFLLRSKNLGSDPFYIVVNNSVTQSQFNPSPAIDTAGTANANLGTVTITSASHGLANGAEVVIFNSTTTPSIDGTYTISNATVNTFDIAASTTVAGNVNFATTALDSDNQVQPNVVFFSKFQEPEAVPIVNNIPVGPQDQPIQRILPLRESLFILKTDGIYRLTGEAGNFIVDAFDLSSNIVAPDSAVVLNNQVYMLSTQGVVTISDTGVSVISRPIEDEIVKLTSSNFDFEKTTFGVTYETDRAYLLFTVTNETDTVATQCFRYNTFINGWTRWPISKTCGLVNLGPDQLFLGAADENFIERERKDFRRTDYADRQFDLAIPVNGISDNQIELSSSANAEKGDALVQTQNLTISQFNRLLKKLDLDPGVADTDYFSSLEAVAGVNLRNFVDNLAVKLDADTGIDQSDFAASISGTNTFAAYQTDFNTISTKLNSDSGVIFTNYRLSEGTVDIEVIITSIVRNSNLVNVRFNLPFIVGPVVLFKSIPTEITYSPMTFGDPSIMKQVREGTIMFENTVFSEADVLYSSDLSPDFEGTNFDEAGNGDWSLFIWDRQNWGGEGSSVPLRTYIPRDKQRCRFINKKFMHEGARERYAIFGVSYTFRPISEKAYRD